MKAFKRSINLLLLVAFVVFLQGARLGGEKVQYGWGIAFAKGAGTSGEAGLNRRIAPQGFSMPSVKRKVFKERGIRLLFYAKNFGQGNAVYVEVVRAGKKTVPLTVKGLHFGKKKIPLTKKSWGWRGVLGLHPEMKPGYKRVVLKYSRGGKPMVLKSRLYVKDIRYPVSRKSLNLGKFSSKNYHEKPKFRELIKRAAKLKKEAFRINSHDKLDNFLSHPRDFHKITGAFWKKRIYLYHKKNKKGRVKKWTKVSFHRGLDFKGAVGAPIYAIARGRVVLAAKMFYEGNMVVVDHGKKVFSYYMHMSKLGVEKGQIVSAGDFLGRVGATGMVTGPHLHLAVMIRGVHVDPLSFICLPIRE